VFVKANVFVTYDIKHYNENCPFSVHYESAMFYGTGPGAYHLSGEPFSQVTDLTHKHETRETRVERSKHSSLFVRIVIAEEKKFCNIATRKKLLLPCVPKLVAKFWFSKLRHFKKTSKWLFIVTSID
jgi:hypothetical protein